MATSIKVNGAGAKRYQFPNGTKWKECSFNDGDHSGSWTNIRYHNGVWMVGNSSDAGIYRSIDGKTWTSCSGTSGYPIKTLYGANGVWVASGDDNWYSTDNGITWTTCIGTTSFSDFLYSDNGIWVGGGSNGISYSNDGKTWVASNVKAGTVNNIYFANGIFIASMESGALMWSTDCKTWTSGTINTTSGSATGWYAVQNHNGIWVALNNSAGAYYSTDGKTWTQSNYTGGYCYYKLAYGKGTWAFSINPSTGWNGVYYSTNGKNWNQSDMNIACTALHYNNDLWIAATQDSDVYYSYDAKHWVKCADKVGGYINGICSANGISVAGGVQGCLYYSPTWEPTIPAGDYMFSAETALTDTPIGENLPFTSANTTYSKMSITS